MPQWDQHFSQNPEPSETPPHHPESLQRPPCEHRAGPWRSPTKSLGDGDGLQQAHERHHGQPDPHVLGGKDPVREGRDPAHAGGSRAAPGELPAPTSTMLWKGTVPLGAAREKRGSRNAGRPWGMLPVSLKGWEPITWKE